LKTGQHTKTIVDYLQQQEKETTSKDFKIVDRINGLRKKTS
jgi:hypothetical protein